MPKRGGPNVQKSGNCTCLLPKRPWTSATYLRSHTPLRSGISFLLRWNKRYKKHGLLISSSTRPYRPSPPIRRAARTRQKPPPPPPLLEAPLPQSKKERESRSPRQRQSAPEHHPWPRLQAEVAPRSDRRDEYVSISVHSQTFAVSCLSHASTTHTTPHHTTLPLLPLTLLLLA